MICTMTGLVILTTGVWHDRERQAVLLDAQSAVTAMVAGAEVQPEGVVRAENLAVGRYEVDGGTPRGLVFVRNHATVEEATVRLATDAIGLGDAAAFDGVVEFTIDAPGDTSQMRAFTADGRPVGGVLVLDGLAMQNGSPLTAWAFREGLGRFAFGRGHLLVTISVFFFGLSTAISWSYYGDRSMLYLAGPRWVVPYRVVFCVAHFLGAVYSLELVWAFGDLALGLMTIPNLLSILLLTGLVTRWTRAYAEQGKLEPPQR
jgi:AGCS family alanine or glycine:cation symporter